MINLLRVSMILRSNPPATASAYPAASALITTQLPHLLHQHKTAKHMGYEVFCRRLLLHMDFQTWYTATTTSSTHSVLSL